MTPSGARMTPPSTLSVSSSYSSNPRKPGLPPRATRTGMVHPQRTPPTAPWVAEMSPRWPSMGRRRSLAPEISWSSPSRSSLRRLRLAPSRWTAQLWPPRWRLWWSLLSPSSHSRTRRFYSSGSMFPSCSAVFMPWMPRTPSGASWSVHRGCRVTLHTLIDSSSLRSPPAFL